MKYNAGIKSMIDLLRRGEGVVKVIEHGRTRLETQSTRGKPPATIVRATVRRRRCAAGRRTTPCSACTCRRTPARRGRVDDAAHRHDGKTHQFHRALVARESAAAGHGFERHGLAAFAGCHLCGNHIESRAPSRTRKGWHRRAVERAPPRRRAGVASMAWGP